MATDEAKDQPNQLTVPAGLKTRGSFAAAAPILQQPQLNIFKSSLQTPLFDH